MMKRTLSLLMALIMVVGLLPNTLVFATDANDDIYIDESSSLEELVDLGVVDIPEEEVPIVEDIVNWEPDAPEEDTVSPMEHPSDLELPDTSVTDTLGEEAGAASDLELPDTPMTDAPELPAVPEEPGKIVEDPDPDLDGEASVGSGSGSLGGILSGNMVVGNATSYQDMVWAANATGQNVDQNGYKIDTYDGYPYYKSTDEKDYTIKIIPDATAAAVEGTTQLHINLYQVQVRGKAKLSIYLDKTAFAEYPNVTEVVIHAEESARDLIYVAEGGSLTLKGLPGCRLVLDRQGSNGSTSTTHRLIKLGDGTGVGNVNVSYVNFRNATVSAVYAAGGYMASVNFSNCRFGDTCKTENTNGGAIYFVGKGGNSTTAVENLTISNCFFYKNEATTVGGAVSLNGYFNQVTIQDNQFTSNKATNSKDTRGGALAITGYFNQVTLTGNTYYECSAVHGGAIAVRATVGKLTVSDTFKNCSAAYGGAISINSATVSTSDFPHIGVTENWYNRIGTLEVDGSTFTGCTATDGPGGALTLLAQIQKTTIKNSSFQNCSSGGVGGGISFSYTTLSEGFSWGFDEYAEEAGLNVGTPAGAALRPYVWENSSDGIVTTMGAVSIENTILDGCSGTNGGGVCIRQDTDIDSFTVENTEVKNCRATSQYGGGLALLSKATGNTITLTDVTLHDNISASSGGGLYLSATEDTTVSITDIQVYGNTAGAYKNSDGTITQGTADYYGNGGGIFLTGSDPESVTFTGGVIGAKPQPTVNDEGETVQTLVAVPNQSCSYVNAGTYNAGYGGGLGVYGLEITLQGTEFLYNEAGYYGGGLAAVNGSTLNIYGGSILGNQAYEGAGIALYYGSSLSINPDKAGNGVQIKDNIANGDGGGIYLMPRNGEKYNSATITGATIADNKAGESDFGGTGGGIAVSIGGTVEIIDTEISGNNAQVGYVTQKDENGKVVYDEKGNPKWVLATDKEDNPEYVEGGTARKESTSTGTGGGVYCYGAVVTVRGCEIHHNTSGRRGGGMYGESGSSIAVYNITADDGTVTTQSEIYGNVTRDYGGGIGAVGYIVKKNSTDDTDDTDDTDGTDGGDNVITENIVAVDRDKSRGATLLLDGTLVKENSATRYGGGGVYISSLAECRIINNAVVEKNTSTTHGGGIMANIWGTVYVTDAQVIDNDAGGSGGGAYISSHSNVVITDGEISRNTAAINGGGVLAGGSATWGGSNVTITRGKISYNQAAGNGGGVYAIGSNSTNQEHSSTVLIQEGTEISHNEVTSGDKDGFGGGVYVARLSTVTIEGGLITENTASRYGGGVAGNGKAVVTLEGGQILQNYAGSAGGIYVGGLSTVNVNGGLIKLNTATAIWNETQQESLYGNGGGVMATDNAQINITGGQITKNNAISCTYYTNEDGTEKSNEQTETCTVLTEDGGMGGGVYATGEAKVLLEGGSVTENEARYGGGICSDSQCSVTVQGGSVAQNTASKRGGGIYAGGSSKVTMEPKKDDDTSIGSITGNSSSVEGGGIYATDSAQVTLIKGNIQSNTAKDGGGIYASGVKGAHSTVTVNGGQIGGLLEDSETSGGNTADGGKGGGIYADCGAAVTVSGGQITKNRAKIKDGAGGDGGGIYASGALDEDDNYISGSVTVTGGEISSNIADGNGGGIYATITSSVLVNGGDVKKNQAVNGAGICSNNEASVTVQGGSVAENTASQCGGGIYACGSSTVTMEPKQDDDTSIGSITGNTASVDGGGIYATGSAQVTLTKGNIQSNTATTNGGGICATGQTDSETAPYVYVNGGTIEKNTAKYGGGICGTNSATVLVDNGKIIDNDATCGGGLCVSKGAKATVNGGEISDNSATSSSANGGGGGIYVNDGGTVEVSGGVLNRNTAKYGGGLSMYTNATVSVTAGKITNNQATNGGGGVYMYASSVLTQPAITITGGEISGNIVETGNGGGISATGHFVKDVYLGTRTCKIEINGGTISGNKINGDGFGGGIALDNKSTCTISNGEIYQNSAVNGGGIYAANNSSISITGGYIGAKLVDKNDEEGNPVKIVQDASNTATENGGGIYATDAARVTLTDGVIQSNTATANGGGIYADGYYVNEDGNESYGGATVIVTGGTITGNKAGFEGAGIYTTGVSDKQKESCGQVTISGGTIIGNEITGKGYGGGIATRVYSQVTLKGGTVTENKAPNGGGVYAADNSTVTIQGGFIQKNNATATGGGIYATGSAQVTMEPKEGDDDVFGSIIGNTATTSGGGVQATDAAQVTLRKGIIKENSAKYGGGIFAKGSDVDNRVTVLMNGGTVEYNTAN